MTELQKRISTGLVGGAALVSLMVWGGIIGIQILALILSFGMMVEFVNITFFQEDRIQKRTVTLSLAVLIHGIYFVQSFFEKNWIGIQDLLTGALLVISFYFLVTAKKYSEQSLLSHCQQWMFSVFGFAYLVGLPLYLPQIRSMPDGLHWVILFFLIVWSGDTFAYFGGKRFGKTKLYPEVSPKKTVEGGISGLIGGAGVASLYGHFFLPHHSVGVFVALSLVVGVVAAVGDLCESLLKRGFQVKDSGSILPGHGGFLDRFDSVVFSLPIMYASLRFIS